MLISRHSKIDKLIKRLKEGSIFVISDFNFVCSEKTASKNLERITDEGKIVRIKRGVYWKPYKDPQIGPDPDSLARAIARIKCWTIIPTGDNALYSIGLRQDKPKVYTYLSDGCDRKYRIGDKLIYISHTTRKNIEKLGEDAAIFLEAIKVLKKKVKTKVLIDEFSSVYSLTKIERILKRIKNESKYVVELCTEIKSVIIGKTTKEDD